MQITNIDQLWASIYMNDHSCLKICGCTRTLINIFVWSLLFASWTKTTEQTSEQLRSGSWQRLTLIKPFYNSTTAPLLHLEDCCILMSTIFQYTLKRYLGHTWLLFKQVLGCVENVLSDWYLQYIYQLLFFTAFPVLTIFEVISF